MNWSLSRQYTLFLMIISFCTSIQILCASQMDPAFLLDIVNKMRTGQNVIFTKYGDGEHECMEGRNGQNCDGDRYHAWLGSALQKALVSLIKKPNVYIAKWWYKEAYEYCNAIARQHGLTIPWVNYHIIMNNDAFLRHNYMYKFVEFVVTTKRKKIFICNSMNKKLKDFFRADVYIEIPSNSWSYEYEAYKAELEKHVEKNALILISGGLCSKVLIDDITTKYDVSFIDLGSAFDMLARKYHSRANERDHTYADELRYYKNFIPQGWDAV